MQNDILLTCRTCGRDFILPAGQMIFPCPGCQTAHSRPRAEGQGLADLRRAHAQRAACQFTDAARSYQRVLGQHPDEAEALWGLALCRYGVEYVCDDHTQEQRPVLHFLERTPFTEDNDYRLACARAQADVREQYLADGAYIGQVQRDVLAAETQQESWDVFLCYKQSIPGSSDPNARTREFDHARDLYDALNDAGYRVFFAHKVLPHVAGAHYEAKVLTALLTARVMLVVCSNPAYLDTPWVHSEWSRYLRRVDRQEDCLLIPLLYDGCSAYALPDPFIARSLQGLDMRPVTALDVLRQRLQERIRRTPPEPVAARPAASKETQRALLRMHMALEDGAWQKAETLAADLIDEIPDCGEAHLCLLLARRHFTDENALAASAEDFDGDMSWRRALRFADPALKEHLESCITVHQAALENARKQRAETDERIRREQEEAERIRREQEEAERIRREKEEAERKAAMCELVGTLESLLQTRLARQQDEEAARIRQRDKELTRIRQLLRKGDWRQAESSANDLCSQHPDHGPALLCRLLARLRLPTTEALASCVKVVYDNTPEWKHLLACSTPEMRARLTRYANLAQEHRLYLEAEGEAQRRREEEAEQLLQQYLKELSDRQNQPAAQSSQTPPAQKATPVKPAVSEGVVTFTRKKELLFGKMPIHLYLDNQSAPVCSLKAGDPPFSIRCSTPTTIRARTADNVDCFTWKAEPGIFTQFEVTWPLLDKPRFTVVSSHPYQKK
ncbi:MAG: TIR domain-containing protein [Clostridia bacterium]|nr:TIR domain-containing protein [Clostridia bacterium]